MFKFSRELGLIMEIAIIRGGNETHRVLGRKWYEGYDTRKAGEALE